MKQLLLASRCHLPRRIAKEGDDGWVVANIGFALVSFPIEIGGMAGSQDLSHLPLQHVGLEAFALQMLAKRLRVFHKAKEFGGFELDTDKW